MQRALDVPPIHSTFCHRSGKHARRHRIEDACADAVLKNRPIARGYFLAFLIAFLAFLMSFFALLMVFLAFFTAFFAFLSAMIEDSCLCFKALRYLALNKV